MQDPLALAVGSSTSSSSGMALAGAEQGLDDLSFDNYCMVCDKLIIPPREPEPVPAKVTKKKAAGGTIRVKNADGSTTTRTANGTKTTRPGLKRNPTSQNRLAAVAAANSNATKSLTRKHSESTSSIAPLSSTTSNGPISTSPKSNKSGSPPPPSDQHESPFHSAIYCSRECAQVDAGRSSEAYQHIARSFSHDYTSAFGQLNLETNGVVVNDQAQHPYGPPSPLFVSGSDTDSSNAGGAEITGPACSAPKTLEYFRMSKAGPDEAWHEYQRQRRSSMHPSIAPVPMARQPSSRSSTRRNADMSSDSLSSLWNATATEAELTLARTTSYSGNSDRAVPIQSISSGRSMARSNHSQTSLASENSLPPELGSAPSHTLSLLQSYATAFPIRDASGTSASQSHKGFVFPSSQTAATPDSRRGSMSSFTPLNRPNMTTLRARRSESGASNGYSGSARGAQTWDEFGLEEVHANNARARAARRSQDETITAPVIGSMNSGHLSITSRGLSVPKLSGTVMDITPKQSLEVENGKWRVKYHHPISPRSASISHSNAFASSTRNGAGTGTIKSKKTKHRSPTSPSKSSRSARSTSSNSENEAVFLSDRSHSGSHSGSTTSVAATSPETETAPTPHPLSPRERINPKSSRDMPPPTTIPSRPGLTRAESANANATSPSPASTPLAKQPTLLGSSVPRQFHSAHTKSSQVPMPMPDLAALRANTTNGHGHCVPLTGFEVDVPVPVKGGFNWSEHEKKGGKVYELPQGLQKVDKNKAGLFYFN